jgi:hypothetical protein
MGYTHYHRPNQPINQKDWELIIRDLKVVFKHAKDNHVELRSSPDENEPPELTTEYVMFNGNGVYGHETFFVLKSDKKNFRFTKTNNKPYDTYVCLALLVINQHAPYAMEISSDGKWDKEWIASRKIYQELFGKSPGNPLVEEVQLL